MAKGFGGRGFRGGMGGSGGINMNMVRQAQKMSENMQKTQASLETREYVSKAGGGAVEVLVNGKHELKKLVISPDVVDPQDVEMLQDLIMVAINDAMAQASDDAAQTMGKLTGGMNLGGLGL